MASGKIVDGPYDSYLPSFDSNLQTRLDAVEARIARALHRAGRLRSQVILVAVTKKFSATAIREAYHLGLRHFGENYVQEFAGKIPALSDLPEAQFHLIGHLQSNKAKLATNLFNVVQTVDSEKLLERLDFFAGEQGKRLELMIEVKLSEEQSKTGTAPENIEALLNAAETLPNIHISGLMTMPPWSEDLELSRPYFQRLAALANQFKLPYLSMGMSNDFEIAIEEGSTHIRVGTALFGSRPKPTP